MKPHIYIVFCFAAVALSATIDSSFQGEDSRLEREVEFATEDTKEKQNILNEEDTESKNYNVDWTAYKQKWLEYGKKWNAEHARREEERGNREKRNVQESTTHGITRNLDAERIIIIKEKEDMVNKKNTESKRFNVDWTAHKQKWLEYGNKWNAELARREEERDNREKRDIQEFTTDGVPQNLETDRINLLKEKQDIVNEKLNGNKRYNIDWTAYKQKWLEYGKKWNAEYARREAERGNREKRDVPESTIDVESQNKDTERRKLIGEKQDIVNQKPTENKRGDDDWNVYKQKWNEYENKWDTYHTEANNKNRDKRDVQVPIKDGVIQDLEDERRNLFREKLGIIDDKPYGKKVNDQDWNAYKQTWNEYGEKWDAYHARQEAGSVNRDKRDLQESTTDAAWKLETVQRKLIRERQDILNEKPNQRFFQDWNNDGQKWNEYGKQWEAYGAKKYAES